MVRHANISHGRRALEGGGDGQALRLGGGDAHAVLALLDDGDVAHPVLDVFEDLDLADGRGGVEDEAAGRAGQVEGVLAAGQGGGG